LPATCVRSWSEKQAELFAGKTVILLPDCDLEGLKKAGKARDLLTAQGVTVRWCYLPRIGNWEHPKPKDGLDSYDYFQLGGTVSELRSAITEKEIKSTDNEGGSKAPKTKPKKMTPGDFILEHWGDRLRWNELLLQVELDGKVLQDIELLYADVLLEYGYKFPKVLFADTLVCLAKRNSYHPVREYLESLKDTPPIDISNLSRRYFGTTNPLYDLYLKKTLIAAVARIFEPGCKHDSALILQGKQGIGKSTFFSVLGGPFFADGLGDVRDGKDELLVLHRAWLHEWAELETLIGSRASGSIKAFLSRSSDLFRVPYGRATQEFKRACVITGTTNHAEFLNDPTGSRRFWVIPVQTDRIDTETLKAERDAIWAGAIRAYLAGESWWLSPEEARQSTELNQDYQVRDVWENPITRYLETVKETSIDEILDKVLQKPLGQATKADQMRVGAILTRLGWERRRVQRSGLRTYLYFPPALPALPCPTLKNEVGQGSNPDSASISAPVPYLPCLFPEKNKFNNGTASGDVADRENKKSSLTPPEGRAGRAEAQNTGGDNVSGVPYLENAGRAGRAGRAEQDDPPFASLEDAPAAAEVVKAVLKDSDAKFIDIAEVFSWVDRSLWDKLSQFLSPDDVQKIATYFPPALPALKNGGNRKISVGDRVRYVGKEHWQVCGDRVLTVKAIEDGNAIVTSPKWWLDKTVPIADLELVVGRQYVKPS
jgi:predicted P-loop ATPase